MLFSLICGIILSFYYPFAFNPIIIISGIIGTSILLSITAFTKFFKQWFSYVSFFLLFFLIGICTSSIKLQQNNDLYFQNFESSQFAVKILEQPIEKKNSMQLTVEVSQSKSRKTIGKAIVYLKKSSKSKHLNYSDVLAIKNTFKAIEANNNPFEFDYSRYLKIHSIYHQGYLIDSQWNIIKTGEKSAYGIILSLRKILDKWLTNSILSVQNQKVAKALLLGEKEYLDPSTLKSFSSAGAMHVLAVSGLHVGIIMFILQFVLKPLKKIKHGKTLYTTLIILGVWLYALVTGFSPSVIRASLMFSFIIFGLGLQRQNTVYQSIFVSAFVILLFDPFSLFKVGFQLSYLAVIGIVYFQPKIYNLWHIKNRALNYVWKISSVSLAAQLATFPLGLYYFHQFPNLFLISNMIVIPLAGILLTLGFVYFVIHFLEPIRIVFEYILEFFFTILNTSMTAIESIPNALLLGISITWIEVLLIYAIILLTSLGYAEKSKRLLFLSVSCGIVFLGYQFFEKRSIENQKYITCYNIKKDFALDIFNGSENTFISSSSLLKDDSKLLFHIKHHWYKNKGDKEPSKTIIIDSLTNPILLLKNDTSICILNNINKPIPVANYMIIYKTKFISESILKIWQKNKTVLILHPDLTYKVAKHCRKFYPSKLLFDIKKEGAFQLNYK